MQTALNEASLYTAYHPEALRESPSRRSSDILMLDCNKNGSPKLHAKFQRARDSEGHDTGKASHSTESAREDPRARIPATRTLDGVGTEAPPTVMPGREHGPKVAIITNDVEDVVVPIGQQDAFLLAFALKREEVVEVGQRDHFLALFDLTEDSQVF